MEMFEYVAVLTSIVIGLGIAHLLQGVSRVIQHPGRELLYWVHLTWVAGMFFQAIFWWWWEFRLGEVEVWTFQLYLFVLVYAVVIYLCCALLFPADLDGYSGYRDYFYSRRAWFFGLLATAYVIDLADSWFKGPDHFFSLGTEYYTTTVLQAALLGGAAITRHERYHQVLAVLTLAYQISWALRLFETVG